MGERNTTLFLVTDLIVLIVFIGLILLIFNLQGLFLIAELFILFVLLFFALISLIAVYYKIRFGSILLTLIFALNLLNLLFIYWRKGPLNISVFFITILLSLLGFIIAVASIKKKEVEEFEESIEEPVVTGTYTPGKFIASKTGSNYHAPKCEWAKKIKKANQLWFDSEEEAKKEGYKAHSCLE